MGSPASPTTSHPEWLQPLRNSLHLAVPTCNDDIIQLIAEYSSPLPTPLNTLPNQCVANCLLHHYLMHPEYLHSVYQHRNVRGYFERSSSSAAQPDSPSADTSDDAAEYLWSSPKRREIEAAQQNYPMIDYSDMREALQAMYTSDAVWRPAEACMCFDHRCEAARRADQIAPLACSTIYKAHAYNLSAYRYDCGVVGHTDIVRETFWDTEWLMDDDTAGFGVNQASDSLASICTVKRVPHPQSHSPLHMWHPAEGGEQAPAFSPAYKFSAPSTWLDHPPPVLLQLDWDREREDDVIEHYAIRTSSAEFPFYDTMYMRYEGGAEQRHADTDGSNQANASVEQPQLVPQSPPGKMLAYRLCGVIVYNHNNDEYYSLFDPMQALTHQPSPVWLRYRRGEYTPWPFDLAELAARCYGSSQPPKPPQPYSYAVATFHRLVTS